MKITLDPVEYTLEVLAALRLLSRNTGVLLRLLRDRQVWFLQ